jgi:hypothetical protein
MADKTELLWGGSSLVARRAAKKQDGHLYCQPPQKKAPNLNAPAHTTGLRL